MKGDEIAPPRVTGRQQNRTNVPAASAHEYFRGAVFLPFVDICMAQLHERFLGDSAIVNQFTLLLPKFCNRVSIVEVEELTQLFSCRGCHSRCFRNGVVTMEILLAAPR
jgi:hypothetical protein